jgi:glycolate oxidase
VGGMDDDVAMLDGVLSEGALVTDIEVMGAYRRDRADVVPAGVPRAVVRAAGLADVSATLSWANRRGVAVVPRGAGTGLSGGANAIDGCIVLSLERLTAIREIDRAGQYAVVEAGVINADLGRAAAAAGLFYPPDPGSFEICSIGGNLATNAGGMRCVKYGVTRDSALSLEVVLADGTVINTGSRTRKNVAGYDLTSLFIGSEGTLGVITAATLRLRPAPASGPLTFVASFPTLGAAGDAVAAIQAAGIVPSLLELMDNRTINAVEDYRRLDLDRRAAALLIGQADGPAAEAEASGMIQACTASGADFAICATDAAESDLLLEARRLAGPALMATGPTVIEDVGVPPGQLRAMLECVEQVSRDSGLPIGTCAHAGDGNLHPTMLLPDLTEATIAHALDAGRRLCDHAVELGGTITGEHGVGVLKRSWLRGQLSPEVLAVHHAIKVALDPRNVLNPGRSF